MTEFQILIVIFCVIGVSFFTGKLGSLFSYRARVHGTKDPNEFPDIKIPLIVHELISRFDQKVKLRIIDAPLDCTSLASFEKCPTYIILSKRLFDRKSNEAEQFNDNDILVCAAHELGHFIPKSHFMWLTQLEISAAIPLNFACAITLIFTCLNVPFIGQLACSFITLILIALFFLAFLLSFASREEEERADSFAIIEAKIPVEIYTRSLIKVWKSIKQQTPTETRWRYLSRIIVKLIFNTHPSVECRVLRLRTLYQSDDE